MESAHQTYRFPNGIRLIHSQNSSAVAHFGLLAHTGTRDENTDEHGLAHFMEHMFFKGTKKRTPYQIISRLEDVGGEINAYTTKEETAIYASFLKGDFKKAIELIQDIFIHSTFHPRERKKEAEVILSEIQSYEDTPSELIFDQAEELLFPKHSIGRNILGSRESLKLFKNGKVENFKEENYSSEEIILCFVGDVPFKKIKEHSERFFGDFPQSSRIRPRIKPDATSGIEKRIDRSTFQSHCVLSAEAYSYQDEDRVILHLLNNILGGPGMNSRLNMALRERRGFSYSAESHYSPYTDSGAINIYFSCDKPRLKQCLDITFKELGILRSKLIPEKRLVYARRQLLGQIAISSEYSEQLMLNMAKSHLLYNKVDSLQEITKKLEDISPEKLREIANEIFSEEKLNTLIYL